MQAADSFVDSLAVDDDSLRDLMPSARHADVSLGLLARNTPRAGPSRSRPAYVSPAKDRTLDFDDTLQQQENMPPGTPSLPAHRRLTHMRPPASPALAALMRLKDITSSRAESRRQLVSAAAAAAAGAARPADEFSMLFDASLQLGPASPSSPLKRTLGSAPSRAANGVRARRQPRASMFRTKADQVVDLSLLGEEELERLAWEDMGESEAPAMEKQARPVEAHPEGRQQEQPVSSAPSPEQPASKQRKGRAIPTRKRRSTIAPAELAASVPVSPAPRTTAAVDSPRRSTRNTPALRSPSLEIAPSEPAPRVAPTQAAPAKQLRSPSKLPRRAARTTSLGTSAAPAKKEAPSQEPAAAALPCEAPAEAEPATAEPAASKVVAPKASLPAARISHLMRKREQQRAQEVRAVAEAQPTNEPRPQPAGTDREEEQPAPAQAVLDEVAELIEEAPVAIAPEAPEAARPGTPELRQASSPSTSEPRDATPRRRTRSSTKGATPASSSDPASGFEVPAAQYDAPGPSVASPGASDHVELSPPARPVRARAPRPCASGITIPRSPFARSRRESAVRSAAARALATARSSAVSSRKDARASVASSSAAASTEDVVGVPQGFRLSSTGMLVAVPRAQAFARQTRHQQAARARAEVAAAEREQSTSRTIPRANPVPAWMQQRKAQLEREEEARLEAERARVRAEELGKGAVSLRSSARRVEAPAPAERKTRGAFVSSVDARLRERAAWELKRAEHEKVLEAEREQARSERMQLEEQQYREARARAVPKANPVPASIYGHSSITTKTRRA